MDEVKLHVSAMAPEPYARAPWNKWHWRISRVTSGGAGPQVDDCCTVASRAGRTCVGFDTKEEAIAAGRGRSHLILAAMKQPA